MQVSVHEMHFPLTSSVSLAQPSTSHCPSPFTIFTSLPLVLSNCLGCSQDQILVELQNGLMLVKADLRRKAESLERIQAARPQLPPSGFSSAATPASCKKRGHGPAAAPVNTENQPPEKRPFFQSLFHSRTPSRKCKTHSLEDTNVTPYSRILRSRQQSPPPSPVPTPRSLRGKY